MNRAANPIRSRAGNRAVAVRDVALLVKISIGVGLALAISLMILALWAWQQSAHIAFDADRPDVVLWAVRSAAVAAAALAQAVLLTLVIGNLYRTRLLDLVLRVLATAVFAIALVSAIALGLASR